MPRKPRTNQLLLTDTELQLMRCLWTKGKASASEVQMDLIRGGKETVYTTVKTMLDRLVKAGVCSSKEVRGKYYYYPKVTRDKVAREWYNHLNKQIFGNKNKKSPFGIALQRLNTK